MGTDIDVPIFPGTGGRPELATPFDRWKMQQFVYAPDTPGASEFQDKASVDMLVAASTLELRDDYNKPTKSGIAKMKRVSSLAKIRAGTASSALDGYDRRLGSSAAGANNFEGVNEYSGTAFDPIAALSSSSHGDSPQYFLSTGAPVWGAGLKFDHDNMGRNNVWGASAAVAANNRSATSTAVGGRRAVNVSSESMGSPVRLKSIRLTSSLLQPTESGKNARAQSPNNQKIRI
jgi:hypothetical protein